MTQKSNQRVTAFLILFFAIAYIFVVGFWGDAIATWATSQSSIIQLLIYYATQPPFIIILFGALYIGNIKKRVARAFTGGLLIDIAADIVSTPHCVLSSGFVANAPNLTLCSDTVYIHWLDYILPHAVSYNFYYWILPIILVVLSLELLGVTKFIKYFTKQGH